MGCNDSTDNWAGIYLASGSPRRRELLAQIGVPFRCLSVDVDEALLPAELPAAYVNRLAAQKARAGRRTLSGRATALVLGADTVVVLGDRVLGKPRDRDEGLAMLAQLSGQTHQVFSAVALVDTDREAVRVNVSRVTFRILSARECRAYWESGEPADKAGAYGIQGLGGTFVKRLEGSYSGVMGLPLFETGQLLNEFGFVLLPAWGCVR